MTHLYPIQASIDLYWCKKCDRLETASSDNPPSKNKITVGTPEAYANLPHWIYCFANDGQSPYYKEIDQHPFYTGGRWVSYHVDEKNPVNYFAPEGCNVRWQFCIKPGEFSARIIPPPELTQNLAELNHKCSSAPSERK